jgi:hypothetical protein
MALLLHCTHAQQGGSKQAINLQKWVKALIKDQDALPLLINGTSQDCRNDDEDIAVKIVTHLKSLGLYVKALES